MRRSRFIVHWKKKSNRRDYYLNRTSQRVSLFSWRRLGRGVLILFFLGSIGYVFFFSSFFQVNGIIVQNTKRVDANAIHSMVSEKLREKWYNVIMKNNFFVIPEKEISNSITQSFPIKSVEVKRRPFHEIIIVVEENQPQVTWKTKEQYYYLDEDGVVMESLFVANIHLINGVADSAVLPMITTPLNSEINQPQTLIDDSILDKTLPKIHDESGTSIKVGEKITTPQLIHFVVALHGSITERTGLEIVDYRINEPNYTDFKALTKSGLSILFQSSHDLERQLANLSLIIKEKISKDTQPTEYIDLRSENNTVYLK